MITGGQPTFRDEIYGRFSTETAAQLVEFNKHIAQIDADYLIFVARKSLRLYDFMVGVGGPVSQRHVLSDHVLDQDPKIFEGKRVALIDDTLILGTTLAEAKRKLVNSGAMDVSTHVFAVDHENWCKDLISPDRSFVHLNERQMLTFCAQAVSAMSSRAIPYLADFPFSEVARLKPTIFSLLHTLPDWEAYTLTTPSQERDGVAVYSILPTHEIGEAFKDALGSDVYDLIEIMKIRVFAVRSTEMYRTRIVPLVTLKALGQDNLNHIFSRFVGKVASVGQFSDASLRGCFVSSTSKLRFVQYLMSLWLGNLFLRRLAELGQIRWAFRFDLSEGLRLFGPWLRSEIQAIHKSIGLLTTKSDPPEPMPQLVASIPANIVEKTKTEYQEFSVGLNESDPEQDTVHGRRHLKDLINAFVGLHRKYEIPARQEVHRLGRRVLDVSIEEAPHRDRLKFGFVWGALADSLLKEGGIRLTLRRSNLLSLLLDYLVDLGIAVPVLCVRDGVLFRGYRYGEDVLFGDQELGLAYEVVRGYVESSGSQAVQKIIAEKLLVGLLKVGIAKKFLTVVEPRAGVDGIVRVGYHLHGAVAIQPSFDTIYADEQGSYLSKLLVDRGVLEQKKSDGMYSLGVKPAASYLTSSAESEAHQLGLLIGLLSASKADGGQPVLSLNSLIALMSCAQPRDAVAAVTAELRQCTRWYDRVVRDRVKALNIADREAAKALLERLGQQQGHTALNSARLKIRAYIGDRPRKVVETCAAYLSSLPQGNFLGSHWRGTWEPIISDVSVDERKKFDAWMGRLIKDTVIIALGIFTIELALCSSLLASGNRRNNQLKYEALCRRVNSYFRGLPTVFSSDDRETALLARILSVTETNQAMESPEASLGFALKWFDDHLAGIRTDVYQAEKDAREFGRRDRRVSYSYVLWYDIIDSTGQKSGLVGEELSEYRNRVRGFKEVITRHLYSLRNDASRSNASIHIEQGDIDAKDDEKHMFIAATRGLGWLRQGIKVLLLTAEEHSVGVRALAINTDFAGASGVQKNATDSNASGQAFWEHLSRVKQELRKIENQGTRVAGQSYVWTGGRLTGELALDGFAVRQERAVARDIGTEIENVVVTTPIVGGPVARTE